jgi:hypothetical protein
MERWGTDRYVIQFRSAIDLSDGSDPLLLEDAVLVQPTETRIYSKYKTSIYSHALLAVCAVLCILTAGISATVDSHDSRTSYIFLSISTVFGVAFVCGLTCFLAQKLILRPWCNSGHENEMQELVETPFTQCIFSKQVIHDFIDQKAAGLLDGEFVQSTVRTTLESPAFLRLIGEAVDGFFRSPEGVALDVRRLSKSGVSCSSSMLWIRSSSRSAPTSSAESSRRRYSRPRRSPSRRGGIC